MRFLLFDDDRLGLIEGDLIVDITDVVASGGTSLPSGRLHALIASEEGDQIFGAISRQALAAAPRRPWGDVHVGAPLPRPGKVVAAPVNYLDHKAEMGEAKSIADYGVFLKAPSSVIGPDATVELPYNDVRTDHEAELVVVIGRTARHVRSEDALGYVFGYTCGLDMTVRSTEDRSTRKSFDTFSPIGPVVVTSDEIPDPDNLSLQGRVNGKLRQQASTKELIFGVADLIAYASSVMTLWPGDLLYTGTPAGVGPVADGDTVSVEIERIGVLTVTVSSANAISYVTRPRPASLP
jgi:2-keto-4-pentenoate hydratase/2-oxohepta-3-ene-1,7-dioic acid hydratase in catechol pathway